MKKVSVVIPTHNSFKYIKECIESVVNQTYKNLEIIVIDDNSIDDTLEVIRQINDKRIKIIKLNNSSGVSKARNKGIKEASGDYICFLDSDDFWYLNKIEKQISFIKNKEFIYSGYEFLKRNNKHAAHVPNTIIYKEALKNTTIFTSTVMFNMKYLKKEDIYMPDIKRGQDTATWWQVLKKIDKAYGMDEPLSVYRVGEKSLSSNKFVALKRTWYLYKRENLSFPKKTYCFLCYIKNAIKRRI